MFSKSEDQGALLTSLGGRLFPFKRLGNPSASYMRIRLHLWLNGGHDRKLWAVGSAAPRAWEGAVRSVRSFSVPFALFLICTSEAFSDEPPPDPVALLRTVRDQRMKLTSGRLEFDLAVASSWLPKEGPRHIPLVIVFDGDKRKVDSDVPNLFIGWLSPRTPRSKRADMERTLREQQHDTEQTRRARERLMEVWGGPEAVVRDGLGYWEASPTCVIVDGQFQTNFSYGRATAFIEPERSNWYSFDPRLLGTLEWWSPFDTLDREFTSPPGDSATLVGREDLNGTPVWHVRVAGVTTATNKPSERHFWIEAANGNRLLKAEGRSESSQEEAVSEYSKAGAGEVASGSLPVRVTSREVIKNPPSPDFSCLLVLELKRAELNVPIDPKSFTLAALGMPIGQQVIDARTRQRMGYWDGQALVDVVNAPKVAPPPRQRTEPSIAKLLDVARKDPGGPLALAALTKITELAPSMPEAGEAVTIVTEQHAKDRGAGLIGATFGGRTLVQAHSKAMERLFRTVIEQNPNRADLGYASFGLARMLKERSDHQGRSEAAAAAEADRLFENVISKYGDLYETVFGRDLSIGEVAQLNLNEMHQLGIGKIAPEISGEDLEGKSLSLNGQRGNVVVVAFWESECNSCTKMVPNQRDLLMRLKGRPFKVLGICIDRDREKAKDKAAELSMIWPSWWQETLKVSWDDPPRESVYVLDAAGVIRFKGLDDESLDKAVEQLLKEAEGGK
jgi:AhpC/TSA family